MSIKEIKIKLKKEELSGVSPKEDKPFYEFVLKCEPVTGWLDISSEIDHVIYVLCTKGLSFKMLTGNTVTVIKKAIQLGYFEFTDDNNISSLSIGDVVKLKTSYRFRFEWMNTNVSNQIIFDNVYNCLENEDVATFIIMIEDLMLFLSRICFNTTGKLPSVDLLLNGFSKDFEKLCKTKENHKPVLDLFNQVMVNYIGKEEK